MLTDDQIAWLQRNKAMVGGGPQAGAVQAGADGKAHVANKPVDPALQAPQKGVNANETLYGTETGDAGDIADTDVNQGYIGDCFLLSSIGEIAHVDPALIKHAIKDNGDGTFTVTLYEREGGVWGGVKSAFGHPSFKQVQVTVDGNFPAASSANPGATQDVVGGKKEIWVQVLEKAYAKLHGGYSGIKDGGSPTDAMEALTGEKADEKSTGGLFGGISLKDLLAAFNAGKPIVMNTPDTKKQLPFNLVPDHAYMLEDIAVDAKGKAQIKLRNPWGTTQLQPPLPIPLEKLHSGIESVDIGGTLPKDKP
jgi:Calpain family cysteine protease